MHRELTSLTGISGRRRRTSPLNVEALECRLAPADVSVVIENQTSIAGDDMYLYFFAGTTSGSGVTPVPWNIDPTSGVTTPASAFNSVTIGSGNSFTLKIDTTAIVNGGRLYFGNSDSLVTWNGTKVSTPSTFAESYFDYVEITMNVNNNTSLTIDNSQVDGVGIPSQVTVTPASIVDGVNEVGIVDNLTREDLFTGFQTAMQVTIGGQQPYLPYADLLQADNSATPISPDYRILSPQNYIQQLADASAPVQLTMQYVSQVTNPDTTISTTLTTVGSGTLPTNGGFTVGQYVIGPGVPAGAVISALPNFPTGNTIVVTSALPFVQSVGAQLLLFLNPPSTGLNEWFGPYIDSTTNINGTNAIDEFFTTWTQANPFRVEAKDSNGDAHIYEGYPTFMSGTDINGGTSNYLIFQFNPTDSSTETPFFYYPFFTTNSPTGKLYPIEDAGVFNNVPPPPTGWAYLTPLSASQMIYGALGVFAMGTAGDLNLQNMVAAAMSRGVATTWQTTWSSPGNVATLSAVSSNTATWTLDTTGLDLAVGMNVVSFKIFSTPMVITAVGNGSITVSSVTGFGTTPVGFQDFLTFQNFYQQGETFNAYAMYFHEPGVFIDELAYAISYDDNGGFSTTVSVGNVQGTTTPSVNVTLTPWTSNTPNENYIDRLYENVLNRPPDPPGYNFWLGLLDADGNRFQTAFGIVDSLEHMDDTIADVYQKFLNRAPDPTGLETFRAMLKSGARITLVESIVLASPEYFALSGGDNTGFINNAFQDVLGRAADPVGLAGYLAQLNAGVSRQDVALSILNSKEAHSKLVSGWYVTYLQRSADPAGLAAWVALLDAGTREQTVLEYILSSEEYFNL